MATLRRLWDNAMSEEALYDEHLDSLFQFDVHSYAQEIYKLRNRVMCAHLRFTPYRN